MPFWVKRTQDTDLTINDLGQIIPAESEVNLNDFFSVTILDASADLQTALDTSELVLVYTKSAYAESLPLLLTNSTTWIEKLKIALANCCAATYRFEWTFEWGTTDSDFPVSIRVQLDDTTDISNYIMTSEQESTANSGHGFARIVLTEGAHFVDIDIKAHNDAYSVGIRNVRIEAVEVE